MGRLEEQKIGNLEAWRLGSYVEYWQGLVII
jgi:hypothetical protein